MANPSDKSLKTAAGNMPGPQIWNPTGGGDGLGDWEIAQGSGANGAKMQVTNLPATQPVTVVDGGDVAQGAKADAAATDDTGTWSLIALVKRLLQKWTAGLDVTDRAARLLGHVAVDSGIVTANIGTTGALALDGTDATGVTPPAGGVGIRGWLSGLFAGIGTKADTAATDDTGAWSLIALAKRVLQNWTTWLSRQRNTEGILLASAARTAATNSPNQTNYNGRGVIIYLNVTAVSGTGGVRVIIQGVDPVTGQAFWLHASPAWVIAIGRWAYELYPGATTVAGSTSNLLANAYSGALPLTWKVGVEVSDSTSYTYSIGYSLIV